MGQSVTSDRRYNEVAVGQLWVGLSAGIQAVVNAIGMR